MTKTGSAYARDDVYAGGANAQNATPLNAIDGPSRSARARCASTAARTNRMLPTTIAVHSSEKIPSDATLRIAGQTGKNATSYSVEVRIGSAWYPKPATWTYHHPSQARNGLPESQSMKAPGIAAAPATRMTAKTRDATARAMTGA